jgi:methionyl-tRNA formyltransferase
LKVAYFGGDWFLNCLEIWQLNGHSISHVFCDGEALYNQQLRHWAKDDNVALTLSKPTQADMQSLINNGVECLFCIEYPWLIPTENLPFKTVNTHPSLLPIGRGPTPMSWTLLKYPEAAGISFHKMTTEFDQGDILLQREVSLSRHETLDTYLAKLELLIPSCLNQLLKDFDNLYENATPQGNGSYWPRITLNDRKIDWSSECRTIRRQVAAAGQFGVVIVIESRLLLVKHLQCSELTHQLAPGTVFKQDNQAIAISCRDGICIIDTTNILESSTLKQA